MSKILLLLSVAFLLGSAGLSALNKGKLTTSLDDAKAAHADAAGAHADATKAKTAMTKAQADTKEANQKATDATNLLTSAQSQVTDLQGKVKAANDDAAAKDKDLNNLKDQLAKMVPAGSAGQGTDDIAKQIDALKRDKDELELVKEGLETRVKAAEAQVATAAKKESDRQTGVSMVGLQGRVLAVDRNWNFVVLNIGDRNGVNNNSTLIIQRGGNLVGRVRITSVEPSQSIADIIPNSVPAGVSVQAGDTVVYQGS